MKPPPTRTCPVMGGRQVQFTDILMGVDNKNI